MRNKPALFAMSALASLLVVGCGNNEDEDKPEAKKPTESSSKASEEEPFANDGFYEEIGDRIIAHIHGVGYPGNGDALYVAAHDGLVIFTEGTWYETTKERNDYMGFSVTENGFYSSGHPGVKSSVAENPIGFVKSEDGGKTVESLDLLGITDFHSAGASYYTEVVYVYNPAPNERLKEKGIYTTDDDAKTWVKRAAKGLPSLENKQGHAMGSIAVHPRDEATVVIGTTEGLFLSDDYGETFVKTEITSPVLGVTYTEDDLYLSTYSEDGGHLLQLQASGEKQELKIPEIAENDAINYIAVHPQDPDKISFTTMELDGYQTTDGGKTWEKLFTEGNTKDK